ncbi:HAD family hydrolase [Shewanella gelidii]|uniref:Haloacid dehalogenase n=1 Tax=Shewanella gelidii TaxID=1642821 RepID=A0A917NDR2_9GAMM|nr:HAD-IA family hydrolase [Shewanella gelidii]MCL1098140.1 HAD-IA family hydrolase [Shewanella gelidii]GGI90835.1 haloacid dehalogenase [Shewanella gelidii]
MAQASFNGVLFDLDGTLADTAPDLVYSLNLSLIDHGHDAVRFADIRHSASHGSLAMVKTALPEADDTHQSDVQQAMLQHYHHQIGKHGQLFDGMEDVLQHLHRLNIPVGIVTNKQARFTRPLVKALGLQGQISSIVSGDSTAYPKPHRAPMLLAAQQLNVDPTDILYLGDAERDIIAAHNSRMTSVAALWGYLSEMDDPYAWDAHYQLEQPQDIIDLF